jgi:hypothetical protein
MGKNMMAANTYVYHEFSMLEFLNNLWEARNRVGVGVLYRPARLHRLAEWMP